MQDHETPEPVGKQNHGGARRGAGRLPSGRMRLEVQLHPDAIRWLHQVSRRALIPRGAIIERLIELHCQKFVVRNVKKYKPPRS